VRIFGITLDEILREFTNSADRLREHRIPRMDATLPARPTHMRVFSTLLVKWLARVVKKNAFRLISQEQQPFRALSSMTNHNFS